MLFRSRLQRISGPGREWRPISARPGRLSPGPPRQRSRWDFSASIDSLDDGTSVRCRRSCGAWDVYGPTNPEINRWAIFRCPCGTKMNEGVEKISNAWTRMITVHQSPGGPIENSPPIRTCLPREPRIGTDAGFIPQERRPRRPALGNRNALSPTNLPAD